jgi:DNA-binding PadR family transcriptional regulator/SAM-dependent methyltransferase
MLSKESQGHLRSRIFQHLDGIGTAPTAYVLKEKGVLQYILEHKEISLQKLTKEFKANEGYLNVGLRLLASQGWLTQTIDNAKDKISYAITEKGVLAFRYIDLYKEVTALLKFSESFHPRRFEVEPFQLLEKIFENFKNNYGISFSENTTEKSVQEQILAHIEGLLIGPSIVHMSMNGMFHKYFMESKFRPEEFHKDTKNFKKLLDIFTHLGWFTEVNGNYEFTENGLFYAKRASAYGVTVSYIPTFRKLEDLIFGNPKALKETKSDDPENHVDRAMNVWGSGSAHSGYFKVVDEIIIKLFNKPIEQQPKGILDMGCGNGAFLQHLYYVIEKQTLRGEMLDQYPLILVGVDYNEAALKITKANLIQADIWAKVIWGDIGQPALLAKDLQENYGIQLDDLLNVRTFLDHNRIWEMPTQINKNRISSSTGSFAFEGKRLNNNLIEDSLLEHFTKWSPFVKKFGLILIELHTVAPNLVALNLGKTSATAYDATHGFSDQYIVEIDVFVKILAEAGLHHDPTKFRKFPNSDLATVSVNLFKGDN